MVSVLERESPPEIISKNGSNTGSPKESSVDTNQQDASDQLFRLQRLAEDTISAHHSPPLVKLYEHGGKKLPENQEALLFLTMIYAGRITFREAHDKKNVELPKISFDEIEKFYETYDPDAFDRWHDDITFIRNKAVSLRPTGWQERAGDKNASQKENVVVVLKCESQPATNEKNKIVIVTPSSSNLKHYKTEKRLPQNGNIFILPDGKRIKGQKARAAVMLDSTSEENPISVEELEKKALETSSQQDAKKRKHIFENEISDLRMMYRYYGKELVHIPHNTEVRLRGDRGGYYLHDQPGVSNQHDSIKPQESTTAILFLTEENLLHNQNESAKISRYQREILRFLLSHPDTKISPRVLMRISIDGKTPSYNAFQHAMRNLTQKINMLTREKTVDANGRGRNRGYLWKNYRVIEETDIKTQNSKEVKEQTVKHKLLLTSNALVYKELMKKLMSTRQRKVLEILAQHPNEKVAYETVAQEVFKDPTVSPSAVRISVDKLKQKINSLTEEESIITIGRGRNTGYMLKNCRIYIGESEFKSTLMDKPLLVITDGWLEGENDRRVKLERSEMWTIVALGKYRGQSVILSVLAQVIINAGGPPIDKDTLHVLMNKINSVTQARIKTSYAKSLKAGHVEPMYTLHAKGVILESTS